MIRLHKHQQVLLKIVQDLSLIMKATQHQTFFYLHVHEDHHVKEIMDSMKGNTAQN